MRQHVWPKVLAAFLVLGTLVACGMVCLMAIDSGAKSLALLSLLPIMCSWYVLERLKKRMHDVGNGPVIERGPEADVYHHFFGPDETATQKDKA